MKKSGVDRIGGEVGAFICLGANLGDCEKTLARARALMAEIRDSRLTRVSRVYRSQPQEKSDQPWFFNQVIEALAGARWNASDYLEELLKIETSLGRTRDGSRYGPRIIDADLLLFGDEVCQTERCVMPHPKLCQRAFALAPLREIAPWVKINGKTPDVWLKQLNWRVDGDKIWQDNHE